jgi:hypothetical protein
VRPTKAGHCPIKTIHYALLRRVCKGIFMYRPHLKPGMTACLRDAPYEVSGDGWPELVETCLGTIAVILE